MRCLFLPCLLPLLSCGDNSSASGLFSETNAENEVISSQEIRLDITPSDASLGLLPQSFTIKAEDNWQDVALELEPSILLNGYIHGFSIYPYIDTTLPGEDLPVEAQVQIKKGDFINGRVVNSDEYGYFSLAIPKGEDYQISITPLSPQNVPYTIVEGLSFIEEPPQLDIDLGMGIPIYGLIDEFSSGNISAQAQLIDALSGLKGPQIDITDNGYFQLRAPSNRQDFIVRIKGRENDAFPVLDIPVRAEENDSDGFRLDLSIGDITPSTVSGQLKDINGSTYIDRATIRFRSLSLSDSEGFIELETNNDINGNFTVNLLKGIYDMEVIPPYNDTALEAPMSFTIEVDETQENLGELSFKEKVNYSAVVLGIDGLPSTNVTINLKEKRFNKHLYSGKTDDAGRLNILLPPNDMNVSLIPDNSIEAITNLSLSALDISDNLEPTWQLQSGKTLSGSLQSDIGTVPFALIEVYQGETLLANGLSDMDGYFSLQIQMEE